jgi:RNA polymerase sigma-70 factor (ECF subfamily)
MDEDARARIGDLFRHESGRLVAALARVLGPARLALVEDVVQDALVSAMHAWRFGIPDDPTAWLLHVARNRAIDVIRRERLAPRVEPTDEARVDAVLSSHADAENQLAMMFAIGDASLASETHVTLILRLLCGFSAAEIAGAFLVDVGTIDRRLHRGRARLAELGALGPPRDAREVRARQEAVEQALYLLFNEGYHGSDPDDPLSPAMCADALRLVELLVSAPGGDVRRAHALAALFCFHGARLATRMDDEGVFVPLEDQDRSRWNRALIERGVAHLGSSAEGHGLTRWHLEAGVAFEHARAPSLAATDWRRIVAYYDLLMATAPGPVVALNRAMAIAELRGLEEGRAELDALGEDPRLATYSFFWAARADVARRSGRSDEARAFYARATREARSRAEREAYARRVRGMV